MVVWVIVKEKVYQELKQGIPYCSTISDSPWDEETQESEVGFQFLMKQMYKEIGFPPKHDIVPVIAWHTYYGGREIPDKDEFLYLDKTGMICLEIEIPDNKILLIDALACTMLMEGEYISRSEELEELNAELDEFNSMGVAKRAYETRRSWQRVFDISKSAYILGLFWQIEPQMVKKKVW